MIPQPIINNIIQNYSTNILRSVVFGGGLAYAFSNEFWHHTPLIFLNPFAYASYQVYTNQENVIVWGKTTVKALR